MRAALSLLFATNGRQNLDHAGRAVMKEGRDDR